MQIKRNTTLLSLIIAVVLVIAACGPSLTDYADRITVLLENYSNALNALSANIDRAIADPNIFTDDGWKADMHEALDALDTAGNGFSEVPQADVPELFSEAHGYLVAIGGETTKMTSAMRDAIDAGDIDAFNDSVQMIYDIVDLLNQANAAIPTE